MGGSSPPDSSEDEQPSIAPHRMCRARTLGLMAPRLLLADDCCCCESSSSDDPPRTGSRETTRSDSIPLGLLASLLASEALVSSLLNFCTKYSLAMACSSSFVVLAASGGGERQRADQSGSAAASWFCDASCANVDAGGGCWLLDAISGGESPTSMASPSSLLSGMGTGGSQRL